MRLSVQNMIRVSATFAVMFPDDLTDPVQRIRVAGVPSCLCTVASCNLWPNIWLCAVGGGRERVLGMLSTTPYSRVCRAPYGGTPTQAALTPIAKKTSSLHPHLVTVRFELGSSAKLCVFRPGMCPITRPHVRTTMPAYLLPSLLLTHSFRTSVSLVTTPQST